MRSVPDIAIIEIKKLRESGIKLTDNDIIWLASLGYKVENPKGQTIEAAGFADGIRLSDNQILKPLTVCASKWLKKYGNLFSEASDLYAVAFAMCKPELILKLKSAKESIQAVCHWTATLKVSNPELVRAVDSILADDAPINPDVQKVDTDKLIASLVAITGLPFEYWEKQSWIKVNDVYSGAIKYAMQLSENSGNPDSIETKEALKDMLLAIKEIRERGKKGN